MSSALRCQARGPTPGQKTYCGWLQNPICTTLKPLETMVRWFLTGGSDHSRDLFIHSMVSDLGARYPKNVKHTHPLWVSLWGNEKSWATLASNMDPDWVLEGSMLVDRGGICVSL